MDLEGAITWSTWAEPGGGESGYIAIGRRPPHWVFGGAIGNGDGHGRLVAWHPETRQRRNITIWPEVEGSGVGAETHHHRFQWTFPLETSPHDPAVLYACSNVVHRSTDEGASWQVSSPDLTRNDPSKQQLAGGPINTDISGAEFYDTIVDIAPSTVDADVIWVGTDDGLVQMTRDGGAHWSNVTMHGIGPYGRVECVEPSGFNVTLNVL